MFSFYVNSPYYSLHISFNVSYENLVVHQDNIPQLMTEQWTNNVRRKQFLITRSSQSCLPVETGILADGLQTPHMHILSVINLFCIQFGRDQCH